MAESDSDLLGALEELDEIREASPADDAERALPDLSREEQAFDLKMRGYSPQVIAKVLGCDVSTIYRYLRKYREKYRAELEQEPAVNLIADSLSFLDRIENVCLGEVERLSDDRAEVDLDSGEVKRKPQDRRTKLSFLKAAMSAREQKNKLMLDTGMIPKVPEKLYATIKGEDEEIEVSTMEKTEDEIREEITKLLHRSRAL